MIQETLTNLFASSCYALCCVKVRLNDRTPSIAQLGSEVLRGYELGFIRSDGYVFDAARLSGSRDVIKCPINDGKLCEGYEIKGDFLYQGDILLGKIRSIAGVFSNGVREHFVMLKHEPDRFTVSWDPYTDSVCVRDGRLKSIRCFVE